MQQREASPAETLEARFAIRAMQKHEKLWKVAEGRLGLRASVGFLLPLLLIGLGVLQLVEDQGLRVLMRGAGGFLYVLLGMVLLGVAMWTHVQLQLHALRDLVKRLEQEQA